MRSYQKSHFAIIVILSSVTLFGCSSQTKDAALVGKSGKQMATDIATYFTTLANGEENAPIVISLINKGVPPPTTKAINHAKDLAIEYRTRAQVFTKLADTYQSIQDLANGQSTDVDKSITGLESAIVKLNSDHAPNITLGGAVLPAATVDDAIQKLTKALRDLRIQKDIRKANDDFIQIDGTLLTLFKAEEDAYVASSDIFVLKEYQLAEVLADSGAIDNKSLSDYIVDTNVSVVTIPTTEWLGKVEHQRLEADAPKQIIVFHDRPKQIEESIQKQIDLHVKLKNHKPLSEPTPEPGNT